jgi:hypothetical protein
MEATMSQIVSHVKQIITPLRHFLPTNIVTSPAIDDAYIKGANEFVRLVETKELLACDRERRFKDLPCPICGTFGCEGC